MSANIVLVQGRISSELKKVNLENDNLMITFNIAHNEVWKQGNETKEKTYFFKVKAFGEVAKLIQKHWSKGQKFTANGKLVMDSWTTEEGDNRSMVSILVKQLSFEDLPKREVEESVNAG